MEVLQAEPILPVRDVAVAVAFYRDRLGGEGEWTYLDPPDHGGIRLGKCGLQFTRDPGRIDRGSVSDVFFRVDDVRAFESRHRALGATIAEPLESKPWGLDEYAIRDPDGHRLRFAGATAFVKPADAQALLPADYRIEVRTPSVAEFGRLKDAVGWARGGDDAFLAEILSRTTFCVVASRDGEAVGMLRVVGDGHFFTIWDVMVRPADQCRRVGSEMLQAALAHLRTLTSAGRFVGLFSTKPAFYERHGFRNDGGLHRAL